MKIGTVATARPVEEYFAKSREWGFNFLELGCQSPVNFPQTFTDERIARIKDLGQKYDISYCVHSGSFVNTAEIMPKVRKASEEHLIEYIELAARLEASHLIIHCGFHFNLFPEAVREALLTTFRAAVEVAEKLDIPMYIENMNDLPYEAEIRYLGVTVEELQAVFDAIDSPYLGLAMDIGHANLIPGGIMPFVDAFAPRIGALHMHDNDGKVDRHWAMGSGTVDWPFVFARLKEMGYQGSYTIELSNQEYMLASRDYLRKIGVMA